MKHLPLILECKGYTLLETVVAMALFTSVLLPTAVTMGNLIMDDRPGLIRLSLTAAVSEMSRLAVDHDFTDRTIRVSPRLILRREVKRDNDLITVRIITAPVKSPDTHLLVINKTFLVRQ